MDAPARSARKPYGIPEPQCDAGELLVPAAADLVLVPLLGFDRRGHRSAPAPLLRPQLRVPAGGRARPRAAVWSGSVTVSPPSGPTAAGGKPGIGTNWIFLSAKLSASDRLRRTINMKEVLNHEDTSKTRRKANLERKKAAEFTEHGGGSAPRPFLLQSLVLVPIFFVFFVVKSLAFLTG
jgi:hypothetical protein